MLSVDSAPLPFLGLYSFAYLSGLGLHTLVRRCKLDLKDEFWRFHNRWFYFFSGEAAAFGLTSTEKIVDVIDVDGCYVSVVVEQGEHAVLFWGILHTYHFDSDGNLGNILLTSTRRRRLSKDKNIDDADKRLNPSPNPEYEDRFYEIEGDYLSIRYSDIRSLNIEYVYLIPVEKYDAAPGETVEPVVTSITNA